MQKQAAMKWLAAGAILLVGVAGCGSKSGEKEERPPVAPPMKMPNVPPPTKP